MMLKKKNIYIYFILLFYFKVQKSDHYLAYQAFTGLNKILKRGI